MRPIDVRHLGREHVICCWQVDDVLVDPGPESCLDTLLDALGDEEPRALLLTHIHLDHAGAAGALVRHWPDLEVWVHERGARHLVDPQRLVASARQLYGDDFERLWGEVVPVPERNLRVLEGGESRDGFDVRYTPGHASHHVCYRHHSGWVFAGDTCGVRLPGGALVLPPTPPPDVDLDAWAASLEGIEAWEPARLAVTHFGAYDDVAAHLRILRAGLERWGELARQVDRDGYARALRSALEAALDPATAEAFAQAMPPQDQWLGLDRYWSRREAGETA
ncbi:MAG: MBL fold metallo-hydrolase [Actinomycetota bacterium]|nr:MBL fold metallo-hydrolase [Actinomycetota bacterium]